MSEKIISPQKLIVLCASHLDSERRVQYFLELLQCYRDQSSIAEFHISISFEKEISEDVKKVFSFIIDLKKKNYPITFYVQKERKYQFEHYKILSQKSFLGNPWIIFSDDDDLWDNKRVSICFNTIESLKIEPPMIFYPNFKIGDKTIIVDDLTKEIDEYVLTSCRLSNFKNFFDQASDFVLKRVNCDFIFLRYLYTSPFRVCLGLLDYHEPLYFYREDELVNHQYFKLNIRNFCDKFTRDEHLFFSKMGRKYNLTPSETSLCWGNLEMCLAKYGQIDINFIVGRVKEELEATGLSTDKNYSGFLQETVEYEYFQKIINSPKWK